MATALFIQSADLKKNSIINGSVDPDLFMPYIKIAQTIHIQNYLGEKLYKRLQAGVVANSENDTPNMLTPDEETLIDDYIQDALIHYAIAEYLPFSAFQVNQGGTFQHTADNSIPIDKSTLDTLTAKEKGYAEYFTKRLIDYLAEYSELYPEYDTNEGNEITPEKTVFYTGGFYTKF